MKAKGGFSLAEIIVGLFIVSLITVLIGALGQQAAQFSNKTKQIGTVLELRTKIAAVSKDPEDFLKEMQTISIGGTSLKYNSCLQLASNTVSNFSCPSVNTDLLNPSSSSYDAELAKHAEGVYKVTETELVDTKGKKIAGTKANPFYLSADGLECTATPQNRKCPLMSTGYFFRTNEATNANPGSVKFVLKLESNPESALLNRGTTPMKAQYMSIDVGSKWAAAGSPCPGSSIQVGVRTDGLPMCLVPINCPANSLLVGVNSDSSPICKSIPACSTDKRIVLSNDGNLICVESTPCEVGKAHLGYYSGSSDSICTSPTICGSNEVLIGSTCKSINTCEGSERLTFANNSFSCQSVTTVKDEQCTTPGEFLVGFDSYGKAKCEAGIAGAKGDTGERGITGEKEADGLGIKSGSCAPGSFMQGINPDGSLICSPSTPATFEAVTLFTDSISVTGNNTAEKTISLASYPNARWILSKPEINTRENNGKADLKIQVLRSSLVILDLVVGHFLNGMDQGLGAYNDTLIPIPLNADTIKITVTSENNRSDRTNSLQIKLMK